MKKIYVLLAFMFFAYSSVTAQLLLSTKFESQNVGTAYTRQVWQYEGFSTGSWDSNLSERTQIDDSYSYSGEKSLRVAYPKGGYGPSQTGCQVDLKFNDRDEAYMSYWIRFSDDFSYGKTYEGGKLPGLGSGNTSGSNISDGTNGFTARFMWRPGGQLVVLLYHMDFTDSMGEDQELTYSDGSIVHIPRGEWHHLAERVKTNTVTNGSANPDGELEVWVDGQQVLLRKGLRFRTNSDGVNELYFSTFHGGGNADWSPTVDSYIWFDDIRIGTDYESVKMQTCTNPQLGGDKALCGSSLSLNAQCSETQAQYLTWYHNGEKIADKVKTITASTVGTYTASYDSAWCAAKSTTNVQNSLQVDLGDDQHLCSSSFATLESNVEGSSYKWQKDGVLLPNTTKSIQIKDAGTYKLTASKSG
ncbi:MAG: heparin lyase I family protein, partial [Bacteroidales bacterium]|nr:heparin lyase I family protein [Bacteroidales bacterium]